MTVVSVLIVVSIENDYVKQFDSCIVGCHTYTDTCQSLLFLANNHQYFTKIAPTSKASELSLSVNIVVNSIKSFLIDTYHDLPVRSVQERIKVLRHHVNHKFEGYQIPNRLFKTTTDRIPITLIMLNSV